MTRILEVKKRKRKHQSSDRSKSSALERPQHAEPSQGSQTGTDGHRRLIYIEHDDFLDALSYRWLTTNTISLA